MNVESACALLNNIEFKRNGADWKIHAEPFERFEDAIILNIAYPVIDSSRDHWDTPIGEVQSDGNKKEQYYVSTRWVILAGCCTDELGLYREFLDKVALIDSHEAREALRIKPTKWAPFHPHRTGGMERWGDVEGDTKFGVA